MGSTLTVQAPRNSGSAFFNYKNCVPLVSVFLLRKHCLPGTAQVVEGSPNRKTEGEVTESGGSGCTEDGGDGEIGDIAESGVGLAGCFIASTKHSS